MATAAIRDRTTKPGARISAAPISVANRKETKARMKKRARPMIPMGETIAQQLDDKLKPWAWANLDAQKHVWISFLNEVYPITKFPLMKERYPRIEVKKGTVACLPHQYYRVFTRDNSPAKGSTMTMGEFLENFAPSSIQHVEENA